MRRWWLRTDFDESLRKNPGSSLRIFMYTLALCVAYADYRLGYEYGFSLFYLLPIILATRNLGSGAGYLTAFFSTTLWITTESMARRTYSYPFVPFWNALVRFGLFIIIVMIFEGWEREKQSARRDVLTGAANRRAFNEFGELEIKRCRRYGHPFSLLYIDVDNFKTINDRFGHREGDRLLKLISDTLVTNFRDTDMVARIGGDEFAVILIETTPPDAQAALNRTNDRLARIPGMGSQITMSIGLVTYLRAPNVFEEAVRKADELMYVAKSSGKNTVRSAVFDGPADATRT